MRAVRVHQFGEPEVMRIEEIPTPTVGAGQVLVRVQAVGVNPVETYIRAGTYGKLPPLPYTPGTDLAGRVEAVGEGVTDLEPGDAVYTFGTLTGAYAELALCTRAQIYRLPAAASFLDGACLGVAGATAWRALFQRGRASAGESVLIHGASGGVGAMAVQLARAAGLWVAATAGTEEGRVHVREMGAHLVLDHHAPDHLDAALASTGGQGFDLIVEMLANVHLARDLTVLAMQGRIVVVGSRGTVEVDPRQLMARDGSVSGMSLFNATPAELRQVHAALFAAIESGVLRPPVVRQQPLSEAVEAHRAIMRPGAAGKIVLLP